MNKQLIRTFGASLLIGGMTLSFASVAAEGLYSAEGLLDSDVYDASGDEVGEVEDVLMGNDMSVHSLVLETGGVLGMGGREVVVERGAFTVTPEDEEEGWDDVEYEVHIQATKDEIKQFDEYNEGWWNKTQKSLSQAWQNTKQGAASAWENTKEATSSMWQNTKDAAEALGDEAEEATDKL